MKALTRAAPAGAAARSSQRPARGHALFRQFPLAGEALIATGRVPTPYHVYDGHGLFIGGTADLAAARELLAPEQVVPVHTDAGRALMGVWVFDFTDASLAPHHELQLSLFVSREELAPVTSRPLGLIELMLMRPDVLMLCHGLWNSSAEAVAYNRELLALNARLSDSTIERDTGALRFQVADRATQSAVLDGRIDWPRRTSLRAAWALMRRLGLRRLGALAHQPWIRMPVVNPVGASLAHNAAADSYTKAESSLLREFDPARDRLEFGDTAYRQLAFRPQFVQAMSGFKFVYLFPTAVRGPGSAESD